MQILKKVLSYKYCIFIISYKRADNIKTLTTLKNANVYQDCFIVVADDDEQLTEYIDKYKDKVIVFSKEEAFNLTDSGDNLPDMIGAVYVRNMLNDIAKKLGYDYFIVLDDDYTRFSYRRCYGNILRTFRVKQLGNIFDACIKYLAETPKISYYSFAQEGDFIGGADCFEDIGFKRKAMNVFIMRVEDDDHKVQFKGRMNEDVSAYLYLGQKGNVIFTINDVSTKQCLTQRIAGGMTEKYLDFGTYQKSFYSILIAPNCVKVSTMGNVNDRFHHKISWIKACPMIIKEEYKK